MTIAKAKTIPDGTEVIYKYTGEVTKIRSRVISSDGKTVIFDLCNDCGSQMTLTHKDVEETEIFLEAFRRRQEKAKAKTKG